MSNDRVLSRTVELNVQFLRIEKTNTDSEFFDSAHNYCVAQSQYF